MKRSIIITADGSTTIQLAEWQEQYHSKHGAIQEADHVFIKSGLSLFFGAPAVDILEIGYGTGLNALLTLLESEKHRLHIRYEGVEGYPVGSEEIKRINFPELLQLPRTVFESLHTADWETEQHITPYFCLKKRKQLFGQVTDRARFDLIYFDAFGARVQPELWTEAVFQRMYEALRHKGVLVTYAAKGSVRRAMQAVGFQVERLPGPPGKREMLRAVKKRIESK